MISYRSSYEPDECSVEIDGTEYTFDSGWDIEDIKKLYDEYDDAMAIQNRHEA